MKPVSLIWVRLAWVRFPGGTPQACLWNSSSWLSRRHSINGIPAQDVQGEMPKVKRFCQSLNFLKVRFSLRRLLSTSWSVFYWALTVGNCKMFYQYWLCIKSSGLSIQRRIGLVEKWNTKNSMHLYNEPIELHPGFYSYPNCHPVDIFFSTSTCSVYPRTTYWTRYVCVCMNTLLVNAPELLPLLSLFIREWTVLQSPSSDELRY